MVNSIIINIIILFGLVFLYDLSNKSIGQTDKKVRLFFGILIGLSTIIIMENSWVMFDGALFDSRTIMISVVAFFFAPLTSITATILAVLYRALVGGVGVYSGVMGLLFAFSIGFIWKVYIHKKLNINNYLKFYILGVVVHIFVLLSYLILPKDVSYTILQQMSFIIMLAYPIAVMFLSISILNHEQRLNAEKEIIKNKEKYKNIFDHNPLGIVQYNEEGAIELANDSILEILDLNREEIIQRNMYDLTDPIFTKAVKTSLEGSNAFYEGHYTTSTGKTLNTKVQLFPIIAGGEILGGVSIIEDLSIKHELSLLRERDILTNLLNRNSFDKFILDTNKQVTYPIGIAVADINAFQSINKQLGYDIGNKFLISISNILMEETDTLDAQCFRVWGDEFAIVFEGYNNSQIESITNDIESKINAIDTFDMSVSVSIGYAVTNDKKTTLPTLFNLAKEHMYQNKIYYNSLVPKKTIDVIMIALFTKSKRERQHSERVSLIAKHIAMEFDLGEKFVKRVELAARLHDIGKINISDEILDKPTLLSKQERQRIHKHPESGYLIFNSMPEYQMIADIIYSHHENYDGTGYPRHLKETDIPLEARIISVADAFDAMTRKRPYRTPVSIDEAITEIEYHNGTQFDPSVVEKFMSLKQESNIKLLFNTN